MNYYLIAPFKLSSPLLTYASRELLEAGVVVGITLRSKALYGLVLKEVEQPEFACKEVEENGLYLPKEHVALARFISYYYCCSLTDALSLFTPFAKEAPPLQPYAPENPLASLSDAQQEALEFALSHQRSLLFGDTGSGKTEIYIHLIDKALHSGGDALMLMPEISLTPQMERRLRYYFGDMFAIYHSKVTKKRKKEIIEGLHAGRIRVIAGARSSLFLPIRELALVVVDEEHDDAYKSQQRPRYSAKDTALYLGGLGGVRVVCGSATPSFASYHNLPRYRLKEGYYRAKKSYIFDTSDEDISPFVFEEIAQTLKLGKQAIVFLPTRANFKQILCMECGSGVECPYCSVSMSLHSGHKLIKCHYCGYCEKIPESCPECESGSLKTRRIGTAEVADALQEYFADAKIERFDRDEIKTDAALRKRLKAFNEKEIDILVGTQMLSKGHDYHDVNLAVVLGIDYLLASADFRARERALSLMLQIAGRSGRFEEGRVLVQTKNREFFERYIGDYEQFLKDEAVFRKKLYPPFRKLAMLQFSHKDRARAKASMEEALGYLKDSGVEIVGSDASAIERIANKYRFFILLRSEKSSALINALRPHRFQNCEVVIDPLQFY